MLLYSLILFSIKLSHSIELSTDSSLTLDKVFFTSNNELHDCKIYINDVVVDSATIEFLWKNVRGNFIATLPGIYKMVCNNGRDTGVIEILPTLFDVRRNASAAAKDEFKYKPFDGKIPPSWPPRINIYVRKIEDIDRFSAFYENGGPAYNNVTKLEAI